MKARWFSTLSFIGLRRRALGLFPLFLVVALLVFGSSPSRADFIDQEVGARGQSMGGAFVAMNGDPASLFWNPAAIISDEQRLQVEGMRTSLYNGIDGLSEDFIGVSAQLSSRFSLGFGWTRTGLEDLYHEDVLTVGAAVQLAEHKLSLGVSALFFGASAPGYEALNDPNYLGDQWAGSFSLGILYRPAENLQVGASFENLLRPTIQLVSTSTDVKEIGGRRRFGVAYLLENVIWLTAEVRHHDIPEYVNGEWTAHFGGEAWFQDILALRVGVDDGRVTAGAGLVVSVVRLDLSLITHERLGNTYRASINLRF